MTILRNHRHQIQDQIPTLMTQSSGKIERAQLEGQGQARPCGIAFKVVPSSSCHAGVVRSNPVSTSFPQISLLNFMQPGFGAACHSRLDSTSASRPTCSVQSRTIRLILVKGLTQDRYFRNAVAPSVGICDTAAQLQYNLLQGMRPRALPLLHAGVS